MVFLMYILVPRGRDVQLSSFSCRAVIFRRGAKNCPISSRFEFILRVFFADDVGDVGIRIDEILLKRNAGDFFNMLL